MSTQVLRRRGSTVDHSTFIGGAGELTVDTDKNVGVIHNAALAGGFPLAGTMFANIFSQPQTIAVLSGAPTIAFDIQVDALSRFQVRKSGFVAAHRQEADTSPSSFELTKRGNAGSATGALSSGSGIGALFFRGYDGTAFGDAGSVRTFTTQAWAVGAHGTQLNFNTVPIGSTVEATHATLTSTELSVTSRLLLPNTTSATVGGIYFGGNRAFHNFGTNNTFAGVNAGNLTMTGAFNAFFGTSAGIANTTGASNSFFGRNAGSANTTGSYNSFFGGSTGDANTTGQQNSFFGFNAGGANTTGDYNTFFGYSAGLSNTTGTQNTFFGRTTGVANTTGSFNSFFGTNAGFANTTGGYNTFFGRNSGFANTTGLQNSFFGNGAGNSNTTGARNVFFGSSAGFVTSTGANNIAIGFQAGNNITTGSNNLILGYDIDAPVATSSNQMSIGNLIFGTGVDGTGVAISSGLVGIKVITPITELHVVTTSAADPRGIMSAQHSGDAIGARIHLRKSRGTATAPTTVVTGDVLGRLRFSGYDSANYLQMGSIDVVSVGTIAATRVPTYMAFSTATNVAPSVLTEGFRLTELQTLLMATGKALAMASGANQRAGNAVLVGGTVTVANTSVTANTIVLLTRKTSGGTIGLAITYTVSAATSFTITSDSAIDTSTFSYMLVEVP